MGNNICLSPLRVLVIFFCVFVQLGGSDAWVGGDDGRRRCQCLSFTCLEWFERYPETNGMACNFLLSLSLLVFGLGLTFASWSCVCRLSIGCSGKNWRRWMGEVCFAGVMLVFDRSLLFRPCLRKVHPPHAVYPSYGLVISLLCM